MYYDSVATEAKKSHEKKLFYVLGALYGVGFVLTLTASFTNYWGIVHNIEGKFYTHFGVFQSENDSNTYLTAPLFLMLGALIDSFCVFAFFLCLIHSIHTAGIGPVTCRVLRVCQFLPSGSFVTQLAAFIVTSVTFKNANSAYGEYEIQWMGFSAYLALSSSILYAISSLLHFYIVRLAIQRMTVTFRLTGRLEIPNVY